MYFPSATNLPSSSMNVSTRDNKNEDIIMATSNHQATSNSLNTHQIQHPGRPILCFTNRFTNHFTTKGCTKPNFYQYQPKICNAFTRTKLLLSIFCGAKRQICTTVAIICISLQSQNQNLAIVSDAQMFYDKLVGALQSLQSSQTGRKGKDKKPKAWRLTDGHLTKGGI